MLISRITWKSTHAQSLKWYLSRTMSAYSHLRPGSLVLSFSISCCDICRGIGGDSVRIVAMAFIFCLCPPIYPMGLLHRQWNVIDCRRKSTRKLIICVAFLGLRPLCLMIIWDNIHCLSASVIFNHLDLNKGHLLGQHIWRSKKCR